MSKQDEVEEERPVGEAEEVGEEGGAEAEPVEGDEESEADVEEEHVGIWTVLRIFRPNRGR